jgi:hypothetical protein
MIFVSRLERRSREGPSGSARRKISNQMDLRGLAALSSRILSLLSDAEDLGQDGLELFGVSRICERRGEHTRARNLYEKSIASF